MPSFGVNSNFVNAINHFYPMLIIYLSKLVRDISSRYRIIPSGQFSVPRQGDDITPLLAFYGEPGFDSAFRGLSSPRACSSSLYCAGALFVRGTRYMASYGKPGLLITFIKELRVLRREKTLSLKKITKLNFNLFAPLLIDCPFYLGDRIRKSTTVHYISVLGFITFFLYRMYGPTCRLILTVRDLYM